jgi:hypothetical protein
MGITNQFNFLESLKSDMPIEEKAKLLVRINEEVKPTHPLVAKYFTFLYQLDDAIVQQCYDELKASSNRTALFVEVSTF